MAYNPADLHIPAWLMHLLDICVRLQLPLTKHWRIAMTRPGILMLGALIGIWAAAFYSGNNLLYLCGGMLTAILIASILQSIQLIRHIPPLAHALPEWLEADTPFMLHEYISPNQSTNFRVSSQIEIQWQEAPKTSFQLRSTSQNTALLLQTSLRFQHRQSIALQQQQLQTSAPIGLWRLSQTRADKAQLYIMPQAVAWQVHHGDIEQGNQYIEGDEFHHLRDYIPGDTLSRIHWRKASADSRQWRVKQFQQPAGDVQYTHLCVDLRIPKSHHAHDFERLMGMVWWWFKPYLQSKQACQLTLGQQHFDCDQDSQWQTVIAAIATAQIEQLSPIRHDGVLLSLMDTP